MAIAVRIAFLVGVLLTGSALLADDERVQVNYMLHCQGCHLAEAEGLVGKVPPMKDFVGYFMHSKEGREFLIRVPGVAHSALNDSEITELMNWLITTFSGDQLPDEFAPFTVAEVARLRQDPVSNPEKTRKIILGKIATDIPSLAMDLGHENN